MRRLSLLLIAATCLTAAAPSPEPPLADKRLRVETLLREDLFAGLLDDDQDRLARCACVLIEVSVRPAPIRIHRVCLLNDKGGENFDCPGFLCESSAAPCFAYPVLAE